MKDQVHIVFDCDGTLISSQEAVYEGVRLMMSDFFEREVSLEEVKTNYAPEIYQIAENFGINARENEEAAQKLKSLWIHHAEKQKFGYRLYPEIKELLLEFAQQNIPMYVWTARDRRSTLAVLKGLGVLSYFLDLRCMDDTMPKPHPQGLMDLVGDIDRERILVIGDSYTDIVGAKNFGCRSIAAVWGEHANEKELLKCGATFVAKKPSECKKFVQKLIEE